MMVVLVIGACVMLGLAAIATAWATWKAFRLPSASPQLDLQRRPRDDRMTLWPPETIDGHRSPL
jgi:hypothetical protein